MPTYDYRCAHCGHFVRLRPMAEADEPAACPGCDTPSVRVYRAPGVVRTGAHLTRALDRAAASADQPTVVRREQATRATRDVRAHPGKPALPRP